MLTRLLSHAGALLCALAVALVATVFLAPSPLEFAAIVLALGILGYGLCLSRTNRGGLIAASLAAAGLLMIVFNLPAEAAPQPPARPHELSVLTPPMQPLALASPTLPQQVVVTVDQAKTTDTSVAVPLNDWAALARNTLITVLLGIWAMAKNKLPAPVLWAVKLYGEQKLIEQAVSLALNAVPGAAKGAPLTIDVGNAVLAHALQWVITTVPGFVVTMMGGEDGVKAKLFAALHLDPDASATALGVPAAA